MRAALLGTLFAAAFLSGGLLTGCGAEPPPAQARAWAVADPVPVPEPVPAPEPAQEAAQEPEPLLETARAYRHDESPFGPVASVGECAQVLPGAPMPEGRSLLDRHRWDLDGDGAAEEVELSLARTGQEHLLFLRVGDRSAFFTQGRWLERERLEAVVDVEPGDGARELLLASGALLRLRAGHLEHAGRWTQAEARDPEARDPRAPGAASPQPLLVTSAVGPDTALLVRLGEAEARLRWPTLSCWDRARARELGPIEGHRRWLITVGAVRAVAVALEGRLELAGPFLGVEEFRPDPFTEGAPEGAPEPPPEALVAIYGRCGRRATETWRWAQGAYRRSAVEIEGSERPELCGGYASAEADLDGDGRPERIVVSGRAAAVGDALRPLGDVASPENLWEPHPSAEGSFPLEGTAPDRLEVVDLDASDRAREVLIHYSFEEDVHLTLVLTYREGRVELSEPLWGSLRLLGRGRLRSERGNCGHRLVRTWALARGRIAPRGRRLLGRFREEECAACPAVYLEGQGTPRRLGEVLRQLRGPERELWQPLSLPARRLGGGATLRLALVEEKRERTELDAIRLEVGGRVLLPLACEEEDLPYCAADGLRARLEPGERLELTFRLPPTLPPGPLALVARGFYTPLPSAPVSAPVRGTNFLRQR